MDWALLAEKARKARYAFFDRLVVLEKTVYQFKPQENTLLVEVQKVTKILKDKTALFVPPLLLNTKNERLLLLEAYAVLPSKKKVFPEVLTETPFFNDLVQLGLYKDIVKKKVVFSPLDSGSWVFVRYQKQVFDPTLTRFLEGRVLLARPVPTLQKKAILMVPPGTPISFYPFKVKARFVYYPRKDWDYYVLDRQELPVLYEESFRPPVEDLVPSLVFSSRRQSDRLVLDWRLFFAQPVHALVREKAQSLTQGILSPLKKAQILYQFVAKTSNIANVSISLNLSGLKPHRPERILEVRYADLKDKVGLLIHLLRAVGLDVRVALVQDSQWLKSQAWVLSERMQLLVVLVDGSWKEAIFLDPASVVAPFGVLASRNYGKWAFVMGDKESEMVQIPYPKATENMMVYRTESVLDVAGGFKYSTVFLPSLAYEIYERTRMAQIGLRNPALSLKDNYQSLFETGDLLDFMASNPFDLSNPFEYRVSFFVKDFARIRGSEVFLQPKIYQQFLPVLSKHRLYPLDLTLPFAVKHTHSMRYPSHWTLPALPKPVRFRTARWSYERRFSREAGNRLMDFRLFKVAVASVSRKDYSDFKAFLERVRQWDRQALFFKIENKNPKEESNS